MKKLLMIGLLFASLDSYAACVVYNPNVVNVDSYTQRALELRGYTVVNGSTRMVYREGKVDPVAGSGPGWSEPSKTPPEGTRYVYNYEQKGGLRQFFLDYDILAVTLTSQKSEEKLVFKKRVDYYYRGDSRGYLPLADLIYAKLPKCK